MARLSLRNVLGEALKRPWPLGQLAYFDDLVSFECEKFYFVDLVSFVLPVVCVCVGVIVAICV